jgi:hypothetical protein
MNEIEKKHPSALESAELIMKLDSDKTVMFDNEKEHAAASYFIIKECAHSKELHKELLIGRSILGGYDPEHSIENFQEHVIEPFYEFMDELLDDQKLLLSLLIRYKHKSEWFNRNSLYKNWEENTQIGERLLALNLYEFLFDQGIDFTIEPFSISGEIDLIKNQKGEEPLLLDAKIFYPEKGKTKTYILNGFRQIYDYTMDYNETFGYLIIFKLSETALNLNFSNKDQLIPFATINNKTIYFLIIDIAQYDKSASKRGQLATIEINESDLINVLKGE